METYGEYAFSPTALQTAVNAAIWVISSFVIYGMLLSVLGKLFSIIEKPPAIVTNTFWGQLYGIIVGFFVSLFVIVLSLQFLTSVESMLSIEFLLPPIVTFFSIKTAYEYLAIKTSMQTTVGETVFLMFLTHILNSIILACLLGLIKVIG
ncbi:hypothetical protein OTK49_01935 [Vibrio coralliirubri]|uniref:hypothetical protein n=1 Tax=Vibrio coralliirubri TaxID=1516159 RepID=UPI0022847DA0|nr:hypothetical protein [Vibrio coralliirubri]MCY9861274.1 hypothetical protein [Vibrio coralliirubri]